MSLSVGARLGPYEITGSLGSGGMGEVYRARDTDLGRDVAVKVLPAAFHTDPDRLARFQREAQVLASLNHPAIAAIHGLERSGGVPALVLELVEGETLADRVVHGPLPLEDASAIARQIADALEAAHGQGIVHRDLKPANVKVRRDGTVKVLDFGLAKAIEGEGASRAQSSLGATISPTMISPAMTQAGFIIGTAAYMAPEQAKGRDVDARADIWAFGCVVYEMLTGRRAFPGDDVTDTLAAVVLRDPDWSALPPSTPDAIRRLLVRCLRKDPKQRLHHIADARQEFDEPLVASAAPSPTSPARRTYRRLVIEIVAASVLIGVAVWQTMRASRVGQDEETLRFSVAPPPGVQVIDEGDPLVELSPDGRRFVFTYTTSAGDTQLFTRRLDEDTAKPIAGAEGGRGPFVSPDGKWIGYNDDRMLRKISVDGGANVPIAESSFNGGTWAPDDTIIFTPNYNSGLWRVSSSGGAAKKLTDPTVTDGELGHFWPQMLPDGKHVLFTSFRTPAGQSRIEVFALESGKRTVVMDGGFYGRYTTTGHLLFARSTTIMAVPFDLDRLTTSGQPTPVIAGVAVTFPNGLAQFSVSNNGMLAYMTQTALASPRQLVWVDRTGKTSPVSNARRRFEDPRISPDGRRVALTIRDENDADIWTYDVNRGTFSRVTSSPTTQFHAIWSPDSRRLFFVFEEPVFHIYSQDIDGPTAEPTRVLDGPYDLIPHSVSPDGQLLIYQRNDPKTRSGLWVLDLKNGASRTVIDTPAAESDAALSPDGRWLAYISDATGRSEVYVQAFPSGGNRTQVSLNGGRNPSWSRDSRQLYFHEVQKLMAATVDGTTVGRPALLFEAPMGVDVAADGRFFGVLRDSTVPQAPVSVVANWFEELKRLVPVD